MENIVVLMFLIVFGWLAISSLFFFFLFVMVWSVLKLQKHELIQGRYAVLRLPTFLHGLWISMYCFMEEKAFLKLQGAIVKCGVWRSCSSLLMSLHFFHSIDEANIFHNIR